MPELDKVIHQPIRLRIMAALMNREPRNPFSFSQLGKTLRLTDGNLGAHLQTLERAGYVEIRKSFINRKPCTHVLPTHLGRARFADHAEALRALFE